jgi:hypothetical protein
MHTYVGSELALFAAARNWKSYWCRHVRPFVKGDVLEVGAGIGSNTLLMDPGGTGRWVCLEPDPKLLVQLRANITDVKGRSREALCGTLSTLSAVEVFETIIYIDVLEHIERDYDELVSAVSRLKAGGRVIVLSPAHQFLMTDFDRSIGHFRRYNERSLAAISPPGATLERLIYLDSVGVLASAANRLFLRQKMPTPGNIRFWDTFMVPVSTVLDKVFFHQVGKSILAVWRKDQLPPALS